MKIERPIYQKDDVDVTAKKISDDYTHTSEYELMKE